MLLGSYLVATFFNNFLPSNIGGDVIRIRDSASGRGFHDARDDSRADGPRDWPDGLVLVAALGASAGSATAGRAPAPIWPAWLWAGFLVAAGRRRRPSSRLQV